MQPCEIILRGLVLENTRLLPSPRIIEHYSDASVQFGLKSITSRWHLIERREDTESALQRTIGREEASRSGKEEVRFDSESPTLKHPRERIRIKLNDRVSAVRVGRTNVALFLPFRRVYTAHVCMHVCIALRIEKSAMGM